jgi:sugar lactone lactonase YvrE
MDASRTALTLALAVTLSACAGEGGDAPAGEGAELDALASADVTIAAVGFSTPESVLHDPEADVYLVSNIDGQPLEKDGNGFISRLSPEGEVSDLKWIDGTAEGVTLNAPKGMAILGDSLYVADIDCVRVFVRTTGAPAGDICIEGATFLNDVAVDPNGSLYVSDTGFQAGPEGFVSSGSAAVYRFMPDGTTTRLAAGEELGGPNGIGIGSRGIWVVTFGSGEIYQLAADGTRTHVLNDPQLDGIVFTPDGAFLYSSWGGQAVYRVTPEGEKSTLVEGVDAPADIGYDAGRNRVLIPLFNQNEVWIRSADGAGG